MALSSSPRRAVLAAMLGASLQQGDSPLLFLTDVLAYLHEEPPAGPDSLLGELLLEAGVGPEGHWRAALEYLRHALLAGLAPLRDTAEALLARCVSAHTKQPEVSLACLSLVEELVPSACLEGCGAGSAEGEGDSAKLHAVLGCAMSICSSLLTLTLPMLREGPEPLLAARPTEAREWVRVALRVVRKILEGSKTGAVLSLAHKASPDEWQALAAQLDQLAECAPHLPWEEQAVAAGVMGAWTSLCGGAGCAMGLVPAMRAAQDGWRPWALGTSKTWLPLEVLLESCVEGKRLPHITAAAAVAELVSSLRSAEGASWVDVLLALWQAALRTVHRGHDEPAHAETRLSLLLAVVPMAIQALLHTPPAAASARVGPSSATAPQLASGPPADTPVTARASARLQDLVASLDMLHQHALLLCPPPAVSAAALRASPAPYPTPEGPRSPRGGPPLPSPLPNPAMSVQGTPGPSTAASEAPSPTPTSGTLRDLIVDACTARALLAPAGSNPRTPSPMEAGAAAPGASQGPWQQLMSGAPLTASLRAAILACPASRVEELERVYAIAVGGLDMEQQAAAASTLCGASLVRGWGIQEHAVRLAVQVLTPPPRDEMAPPLSAGHASPWRYLVTFAPMLFAALAALSQTDTLEIVRLHGRLPHLAAALLPICDAFGDLPAGAPPSSDAADDALVYAIFSQAFLLLNRILETFAPPVGGDSCPASLTLPCLLDLAATAPTPQLPTPALSQFPRVAAWYARSQAFARPPAEHALRSPLTAQLLRMLLPSEGGAPSTSGHRKAAAPPVVAPAWDVIAAAPEVGQALLAACASSRLAAKDLQQGLRVLLLYLPAVAVPLCQLCCAEVVRGAWRCALLNGTEWPSPASRLPAMEADMAALLRQAGVTSTPDTGAPPGGGGAWGNTVPALPLPLAVALTLVLADTADMREALAWSLVPPLLRCAASQPWPTVAVVATLVAPALRQGVKHVPRTAAAFWGAASAGRMSKVVDACFRTALHPTLEAPSGLTSLLGESRLYGMRGTPGLSPGAMFIRAAPACRSPQATAVKVAALVLAQAGGSSATAGGPATNNKDAAPPSRAAKRLRCRHESLREALPTLQQAAGLGAALLVTAGGEAVRALFVSGLPPLLAAMGGSAAQDPKGGLQPYVLARLAMLTGLLAWGPALSASAARALEEHLDFLAASQGASGSAGRVYLLAFACLLLEHAPTWMQALRPATVESVTRCLARSSRSLALRILETSNSSNLLASLDAVYGRLGGGQ